MEGHSIALKVPDLAEEQEVRAHDREEGVHCLPIFSLLSSFCFLFLHPPINHTAPVLTTYSHPHLI